MLRSDPHSMTDAELVQESATIVDAFPDGDGDYMPNLEVLRALIDELQYRFVFKPALASGSQSQRRLDT